MIIRICRVHGMLFFVAVSRTNIIFYLTLNRNWAKFNWPNQKKMHTIFDTLRILVKKHEFLHIAARWIKRKSYLCINLENSSTPSDTFFMKWKRCTASWSSLTNWNTPIEIQLNRFHLTNLAKYSRQRVAMKIVRKLLLKKSRYHKKERKKRENDFGNQNRIDKAQVSQYARTEQFVEEPKWGFSLFAVKLWFHLVQK